jgi:trehalose/maltose hydrolase-like predicted phosphorylase
LETFCVPPLTLLEPLAARSLLDYRARCLPGAEGNARMRGRHGLQFPWESAPSTGHEAAPLPGRASWHEDHVTPDVARAFAFYAHVTGDGRFRREKAWPVLAGVADWLTCRVSETPRGFEVKQSMGIAEREQAVDNPAYMNMVSVAALRDAIETADSLGLTPDEAWGRIADGLALPLRDGQVVSHDGYRANETKGATPDPLMGIFPLQARLTPEIQARTLAYYLGRADEYLGSPMLSALYATWAARAGDRQLSARMMDEGYGKFLSGRFLQTLEYRPDVFPEQPQAGPFCANIGAFLSGLLLGLPGLEPDAGPPADWGRHPVVLPAGWDAIEVDRLWVRGRPARLRARHGARQSELAFTP